MRSTPSFSRDRLIQNDQPQLRNGTLQFLASIAGNMNLRQLSHVHILCLK